jgi:hypothetical protein
MTREFILVLALIAGPAFAEKPSSDLTNVRSFNYTTSLDTSIGPRGHSGLMDIGFQYAVDGSLRDHGLAMDSLDRQWLVVSLEKFEDVNRLGKDVD